MALDDSIFDRSLICRDIFDNISSNNATGAYTVPQELQNAISEEKARFRVWAANIGALATGSASLDHRLSESQRVRMLVLSQLSIVTDATKQLEQIIYHGGSDVEDSSDFKDNETGQEPRGLDEGTGLDIIESCLDRAHRGISRLNRTAKAIRLPGMISQSSKAATYRPTDQFGNDIVQQFEEYSLELIKHYFPDANRAVQVRLARANAIRRRIFLYRRKHQEFMSGRKSSLPKERAQTSRPVTQKSNSTFCDNEKLQNFRQSAPSAKSTDIKSQVQSSVGRATDFDENNFQPDTKSVAPGSSIASTFASAINQSRFPPPPQVPDTRDEFECPYCTQLTNSGELDKRRWRRHIIKDLEPYVCVTPECSHPETRYSNQTDWLNHQRTHAVRWKCRLPHPHGCETDIFTSEIAFDAHVRYHHQSLETTQTTLLKRTSRTADPDSFKVCPLCFVRVEDLAQATGPGSVGSISGPTSHIAHSLKMQKHLASHLHFIALFSLPWLDDQYSDIATDNAISSGRTETTRSSFLDADNADHHTRNHHTIDEDLADMNFEDNDLVPDCERNADEWSFIAYRLYEGHVRDPVLEPFIQKQSMQNFLNQTQAKIAILPSLTIPVNRNSNFYGRENVLGLLKDHLLPRTNQPKSLKAFSLHGQAGLGKTQVAAEFIYRHKDSFDAVFWIHVDERSKALEDVTRIAKQLGLVEKESADADDQAFAASLFKAWLHDPKHMTGSATGAGYASWLLVLDHVIEPEILEEFNLSGCPSGSILITGRGKATWKDVDHPYHFLENFTPVEGADFVCRLTASTVAGDELQKAALISETVSGVPYALEHLAKWIMDGDFTFSEFLDLIETREKGRLADLKSRGFETVKPASLDEHYFLESALQSMQSSIALLQVLCLMDPDKIPEHVLRSGMEEPRIENYPASDEQYHEVLSELLKYSLVTKDSPSTLSMPRIVQDGVRKRMSTDQYRNIFNTCINLLYSKWPFKDFTWRHGISRWPQCKELFPHITRLRKFGEKIFDPKDNPEIAFKYARLACDCGWYCHERGMPAESDLFSSLAQSICEKSLEDFENLDIQAQGILQKDVVKYTLAEIHHNRGVVANEINRPKESMNHLLKFNSLMLQELGDKRPGTDMRLALSFNELGCAYMLEENYGKAEYCYNCSILNMEKLDDYENWQTSLPMVNLSMVYWLSGKYQEALTKLKQGLRDRETKFGSGDRESFITGRFLYALGNVYWSLEKYDDSLKYHHLALTHYRDVVGSGHHRTADTLIRLTAHYLRLSRYSDALELVNKAIQVYKANSAWSAEVVRARFWKSKVLRCLKKTEEAAQESRECYAQYKQQRPDDQRPISALRDSDFDLLIVFWSR